MVVEKPNQISWQEWDSSKPVRLCINVVSRDLFLSFPYRYWNFCSFFMDIFKKDTLCMRSHLNCDAVVSLWIWYLPIKQCVSFYRKTSGREMCVKGTKARCFSRVLLSFIHRKALEFAAVFCERYCQTTIFTQKKKCFLYLPKSRGGVWMWTAAVWESEFGRKKHWILKKLMANREFAREIYKNSNWSARYELPIFDSNFKYGKYKSGDSL